VSTYQFTMFIEPDEEAFHAFVPALPGCHTFGTTLDEAYTHIAEAIELHSDGMQKDGEPIPVEGAPLFVTSLSVCTSWALWAID